MSKFLLLIYGNPAALASMDEATAAEQHTRWNDVTARLAQSGALQAGDALEDVDTATSVRMHDGGAVVTDGPFAETKEQLAGYYAIDVPDLDAALSWAREMPHLPLGGAVEVRPVMAFE